MTYRCAAGLGCRVLRYVAGWFATGLLVLDALNSIWGLLEQFVCVAPFAGRRRGQLCQELGAEMLYLEMLLVLAGNGWGPVGLEGPRRSGWPVRGRFRTLGQSAGQPLLRKREGKPFRKNF